MCSTVSQADREKNTWDFRIDRSHTLFRLFRESDMQRSRDKFFFYSRLRKELETENVIEMICSRQLLNHVSVYACHRPEGLV